MKPKVAMLSDLTNDQGGEDPLLAQLLADDFQIEIAGLDELREIENDASLVFIRNIWPHPEKADATRHRARREEVYARLAAKKKNTYNSLRCRGDIAGKEHLWRLYEAGYPVIPTIMDAADFHKLPRADTYLMKHRYGFDGIEQVRGGFTEIEAQWSENFVIQPLVLFSEELHFYFVDSAFVYALTTPHRLEHGEMRLYEPTKDEISLARRFVEWNTPPHIPHTPHSLQRVDMCRTLEGDLLLMELEDESPSLWLKTLPAEVADRFVTALKESLAASIRSDAPHDQAHA